MVTQVNTHSYNCNTKYFQRGKTMRSLKTRTPLYTERKVDQNIPFSYFKSSLNLDFPVTKKGNLLISSYTVLYQFLCTSHTLHIWFHSFGCQQKSSLKSKTVQNFFSKQYNLKTWRVTVPSSDPLIQLLFQSQRTKSLSPTHFPGVFLPYIFINANFYFWLGKV